MLDMRCKIRDIDYDATLRSLYPRVLEKSSGEWNRHMLFRLLTELGSDGERILARLTHFVEDDDKQYLLCRCMESFSSELTELLNRKLQEDDVGKCFSIGALMPALEGSSIVLAARHTSVDYPAFIEQVRQHAPGGFLGRALLHLINSVLKNGDTDQKVIKALENTIVQAMIMDLLSQALRKQGIYVKINHISIQLAESDALLPEAAVPFLDQRTESILVKALAEYLRHTMPEDKTSTIVSA